jgi:DNA-directed RNA polymerase subunit N (RpoN/RPB10)
MLFYLKCPTCSRILSKNLDKFYADREMIENDPNKTTKEKEKAFSKLLDKYGYKEICCRIRIMGLLPYHRIISS